MNTGMLKRPKASMDRLAKCSCGKSYRIKPNVTPGPRQCRYCGAQFMVPPLPSKVSPPTPMPGEIGEQKTLNSNPVAATQEKGSARRDPNQPLRSAYSARNEYRQKTEDELPPDFLGKIRVGSRVAYVMSFLTGLLVVLLVLANSAASKNSQKWNSHVSRLQKQAEAHTLRGSDNFTRPGLNMAEVKGVVDDHNRLNEIDLSSIKRDDARNAKEAMQRAMYWRFFQLVLTLLMAYGISKKSRIASTGMVVMIGVNFLFSFAGLANHGFLALLGGLLASLLLGYYFVRAMLATYQYHALVRTACAEIGCQPD